MKTLEEITKILSNHKIEVQRRFGVKEMGIFGSYVKGKQKRGSDIDILVEYYETPDIFLIIDLEDYLRKILKKKVDIIRKEAIRTELKDSILKEVIFI